MAHIKARGTANHRNAFPRRETEREIKREAKLRAKIEAEMKQRREDTQTYLRIRGA